MDRQQTMDAAEGWYSGPDEEAMAARRRIGEAADAIVGRLSRMAGDTAAKRKEIEQRWIQDMCQFAGVRSPGELVTSKTDPLDNGAGAGGGRARRTRSEVFVNITRTKTNRTEGRLCDMLFPADDRNWGIQPTPSPELAVVARRAMEEARRAIDEANRLNAAPEVLQSPTGMSEAELVDKGRQLGVQGVDAARKMEEAKTRATRMSTEIDDQLVEANYAQKSRDAIGWACKLGIGILKGPVITGGGRSSWVGETGEDGAMAYSLRPSEEQARPGVVCVSPWAFFPDYSATCMGDCEYIFERHLPSKRELRNMGRKLGFYEHVLRELLREGPAITAGEDFDHIRQQRTLTGESTDVENRYIVWEYHGTLEPEEIATLLRAIGTDEADERAEEFEQEADPFSEYRVIAYFCNNRLLKISEYYPMDSQEFLYSVFSLERGAASILGAIGVPRMMRDSQEVLNAAWRMMMDNANASATTLPAGGRYFFDIHNFYGASGTRRIYGCNGTGTGFEFDGSYFVPLETGADSDTPERLAVYRNTLFFSYPNGWVQGSAPGEPTDWDADSGAFGVGIGSDVTDFISNVESLTILGRNGIYALTGYDSTDFLLNTITDEAGAKPYTGQRIGAGLYLDNRGLRQIEASQRFGNFAMGTITETVKKTMERKANAGAMPIASVIVRTKNHYRLFYDDGTGFSFYLGRKYPEPMYFDLGKAVQCIWSGESGTGMEEVFFGDGDGYVYQLDKGTSFDGGSIEAFLQLPYAHLGSPNVLKRVFKIGLEAVANGGSIVGMAVEFDYSNSEQLATSQESVTAEGAGGLWAVANWAEFFWSAPVENVLEADVEGQGRNASIIVYSNSARTPQYVLRGATLYYAQRGAVR